MSGNDKPRGAEQGRAARPSTVAGPAAEPLMPVQVRFYGIRRELSDEPYIDLQVPRGASVRMVLQALAERGGGRLRQRLFTADGAYLMDMLCVAVNGQIVGHADLDAPLPVQGQGTQQLDLSVIFAIAGG